MKIFLFVSLSIALLVASIFFFHQSGGFLMERNYLAGLLHIFVGFATIRGGLEFARLAVVLQDRSR